MKAPTRLTCLINEHDRRCPHVSCPEHLPAIPGDATRYRATCSRAVSDAATALDGLGAGDIAWILGVSTKTVHQNTRSAMATLKEKAEGWET